jgi:hypothetical protein
VQQRRLVHRKDDVDVHRHVRREARGANAIRQAHPAEDLHRPGVAALHLGQEFGRRLLLDQGAAHAPAAEIHRQGQPDRAGADDQDVGVLDGGGHASQETIRRRRGADVEGQTIAPSRIDFRPVPRLS